MILQTKKYICCCDLKNLEYDISYETKNKYDNNLMFIDLSSSDFNKQCGDCKEFIFCEGTYLYSHITVGSRYIKNARWLECPFCRTRKVPAKLIHKINLDIEHTIMLALMNAMSMHLGDINDLCLTSKQTADKLNISESDLLHDTALNNVLFNVKIMSSVIYFRKSVDQYLEQKRQHQQYPSGLYSLEEYLIKEENTP